MSTVVDRDAMYLRVGTAGKVLRERAKDDELKMKVSTTTEALATQINVSQVPEQQFHSYFQDPSVPLLTQQY